jgi:hypothetical protein
MDITANLKRTTNGEKVAGAALLAMLVSCFLPWISVSAGGGSFQGVDIPSVTVSVNGYHSWGWLYALVTYALIAFWVLRVAAPEVVAMPALPLKDPMVYIAGGLIAVVGAILYHVHSDGGSFTFLGWGWFVALASVLALIVGGYLMQQDPARPVAADPYRPTTPPYPGPPQQTPPYSPTPPQVTPPQPTPPQAAPPQAPPVPPSPQGPPSGSVPPPPPS